MIIRNRLHSHRNMNELYQVTNKPHNGETDRDCFGNLDEFYASKRCVNGCTCIIKRLA